MTEPRDPAEPGPASRLRLDLTASPTEVLRRLRHRQRPVALIGAWHHGNALIAVDPDRLLGPDEDPLDDLGAPPAPADGTFGGVAIAPGFTASRSSMSWYGTRLASHGFVVISMYMPMFKVYDAIK